MLMDRLMGLRGLVHPDPAACGTDGATDKPLDRGRLGSRSSRSAAGAKVICS
jgi:hypothetical protein